MTEVTFKDENDDNNNHNIPTTTNNNNNPNNASNNASSEDPAATAALLMKPGRTVAPSMTTRARRRREEAVRRLVADVQSKTDKSMDGDVAAETHDWLVASTVATALEKGLDRDLHAELVQEAKDNAGRIGQVCHDHADVFLASVAQVAALGEPSAELADGLKENHRELKNSTAGPMHQANLQWEQAQQSYARAKTLHVMVDACQRVAIQLERARKQANLGRPKAALDAVDQARHALTTPVESLFEGEEKELWKATTLHHGTSGNNNSNGNTNNNNNTSTDHDDRNDDDDDADDHNNNLTTQREKLVSLEQTPFGNRASIMLPKIENEVLMSARRGLNRWFMALRSGAEGAKVGRAVLRQCAFSQAVGPGQLGLGGLLPQSYQWRAKAADNGLARVDVSGKVGKCLRMGFFVDRDAPKEADRLEKATKTGVDRKMEVIVTAFGFYRCWDESAALYVEPSEYAELVAQMDASTRSRSSNRGSRHGGSRHGNNSRHGLRGSRHGKGRSLGFRATTNSRSQAYQDISSNLGGAARNLAAGSVRSRWCEVLTPESLQDNETKSKEEDRLLVALPESVHPVRRAELAFSLLGRSEEFVSYYESNRFGETKIAGEAGEKPKISFLSALTGDDISVGTDRIFFAKTLPTLCSSVAGFCAVESALEYGNFVETSKDDKKSGGTKPMSMNAGGFREASERYERNLIDELGAVARNRAVKGQLCELARASVLMSVFKGSLKICHPSSSSRRFDKDLLAVDKNILLTALKVANDEQLKVTSALSHEDQKVPMMVADAPTRISTREPAAQLSGIPDPEINGLPFGLSEMIQKPQQAELDFQDQARTRFNRAPLDEAFTFSTAVPQIIRTLHARSIAFAVFALSQMELGQQFPEKKCSYAAGYVLDGVEGMVSVTAIGMKDSDSVVEEGSVEKAVQVMANISALRRCLPRFYACLVRGMYHIGLLRSDELDATVAYAERIHRSSDKACDAQVGSMYSLVYEICRNKIDSHINLALENFQWVAKSTRDMPNSYCEGLIGYLKSVFASLGPMDEGSRAGLHFSCCGHVAERLVKLLSGKPGDTSTFDDSSIPPIARIDAFGIKNLHTDCKEFERFADSTGIAQLRDCFNELRILTSCMLDKELPILLLPENSTTRRRKYPILSMDKVLNMLEKYQGTGLGDKLMGGSRSADFLFIDKKEVTQLIKIVRSQTIS